MTPKPWLVALALAAPLFAGGARADGEAKVTLSLSIAGLRNAKGQAIVALFNDKDGWPKLERALRTEKVKLGGTSLSVSFKDLPPGTYAVEVIHDENENGKLDMRWLPFPKPIEGAAASNNPNATLGPPSWSDARFRLSEKGGALQIQMKYW